METHDVSPAWANAPKPAAPAVADLDLPSSDGMPMESQWHIEQMNFLVETVRRFLQGRNDQYVGGNQFIYFSPEEARTQDFRGPDFFCVTNGTVDRERARKYWAVWEQGGKFPDVIIELMSPSTRKVDLTTKKKIYEQRFHAINYYCYDPNSNEMFGWHLVNGKYKKIVPDEKGRMWCDALGLWLGHWTGDYHGVDGEWLRFFHPDGSMLPTYEEDQVQRAIHANRRVESANRRADAEKARADALEAELAKLRKQLEQNQ